MISKKNVALVTGGDSGEITISLKSAKIIEASINKSKFNVFVITIANKSWTYQNNNHIQEVDKNDFSIIVDNEKILFDIVFIAIHGTPGENGKLQGYFDLLNIPYTSCDLTTSAITFNKFYSSQLLANMDLCDVADSVLIRKGSAYDCEEIIETTGLPCFVKPNEGGSSLGITKVTKKEALKSAIEEAFEIDNFALIETFIKGREITCGVINTKDGILALPITEIISKNEYFDFEAKYNKSKADEITPADLPVHISENCQYVSKELYVYFNCKGIVRFDYILSEDNKLYFLEVNTIPGMTKESIVPQQAEAANISIEELFTIVLENAVKNN